MNDDLPLPSDSFSTFIDTYYLTAARDHKGKHRLRWTIDFWKSKFGDTPVSDITKRSLSRHVEARRADGKSNGTINREISILSSAINYAIKRWDWNIANPAAGLHLKTSEGRLRWLSQDEYRRLLAAALSSDAPHLYDFIQLAVHTGMRRTELLQLERSRIDLLEKRVLLEGRHCKSGRRRIIPLNAYAIDAIRRRLDWNNVHGLEGSNLFLQRNGKPVVQINTAFTNAVQKAGLVDFRLHDLRHTFASWLVGQSVTLPEVRDLLGHSSVKQTERYAHLAPGRLHQAVAALEMVAGVS